MAPARFGSKKSWKQSVVRTPVIGRLVLLVYRAKIALGFFWLPLRQLARWLFASNETTNHTYDLQPLNQRYLTALLAQILDVDYLTIERYINEALHDQDLRQHIRRTVTANSLHAAQADPEARLGRRLGWYAVARVLKPKVIVETGVDKGLGAVTMTAALKRNAAEGHPGRYYGTDINPEAGYLLSGEYAEFGEILYGDSIESLTRFDQPIDLFVNDSDHSADYEAAEYDAVVDKLSDRAIILGDNSHATDKLLNFSLKHGRMFAFFAERPTNHWYPGGGIGISYL